VQDNNSAQCQHKILTLWAQFQRSLKVYSLLLPTILTIMAVCVDLFSEDSKYIYCYTSSTLTTLK